MLGVGLVIGGALLIAIALLLVHHTPAPGIGSPSPSGSPMASSASSGSVSASGISPTAEPTPAVTPAPTPRVVAETGVDLTWRAVATLAGTAADPSTQTVRAVDLAVAPGGGYIAVGQVIDGLLTETGATGPIHPAIWTSTDGLSWQPGDARGLGASLPNELASNGHQLMLVASAADHSVVLRSADGHTWTDVSPPGATIMRVITGGPGFVALGERLASQRFAIWTTADGSSWRLAWESDVASGEGLRVLAARPDGQLLVGGYELRSPAGVRAAAVVSGDGVTWRRVRSANLPATMGFDAIGVGADGAWYAAGFDDAGGGIGVWRSADGTTWHSTSFGPAQVTELPGDTGSAAAVFAFDRATFVLAFTSCCGDPPQRTLVSRDGGSHWQRADRAPSMAGVHLTSQLVTAGPMLAVGNVGQAAGVWAATAAPANGVELPTELRSMAASEVCSGAAEVRVRLDADRSGAVVRLRLVRLDNGEEFGPIVWPYGWSATLGTTVSVRNASGVTVAREGDDLTLSGGAVVAGSYHLCRLNGQPATTR